MRSPIFVALLMLAQYLTPTIHGAVLDENLVLRIRFDDMIQAEPESFFVSKSGGQADTFALGTDGQAIMIPNKYGNHVTIFNPPPIEDHFTVSMWIKAETNQSDTLRGLMSWGAETGINQESHGLFITPNHQILVILNWNTPSEVRFTSKPITQDLSQWNHFAYSYSREDQSLAVYLNSKTVMQKRATWRFRYTGLPIHIGANPSGSPEIFPGMIDDFRLYNNPVTQSDTQSIIDEFIPRIILQRIEQGSMIRINNPRNQALEVLATSDFLSWDSVHVTGTSKLVEYFFDNLHQGDLSRFYMLRQ